MVKILFLCTGNSCRSQMAEGFARALKSMEVEADSAGVEIQGLNPNAVKVMAEVGVDIGQHRSKQVDEFAGVEFDYVITVCDEAQEKCPVFPGNTLVHVPFDDPPRLVQDATSEEAGLAHYRRVRDEIHDFVRELPDNLVESKTTTC